MQPNDQALRRIKAVASKLTPEELAAPVSKLTTVNQLIVVATCISVMLETIAETQGKPETFMSKPKTPNRVASSAVVRRYLQVMEAGCRKNWRPNEGSNSHYLNWLMWEALSKEHKVTAEEADATWQAFLARHGETYPTGNWREKEIAYMESLAPNAALSEAADKRRPD